jgi:rhamnosyltransferase
MNKCSILLSSFNGAKFIATQLNSLLSQDYQCFNILIRDDASSDSTKNILANQKDIRIQLLADSIDNIGIKRSFDKIIESVSADYYCFADQDDIWLPNKLSKLIGIINEMDNKKPCLVFSDMHFIDQNGELILKDFIRTRLGLKKGIQETEFLQGHISGCLMLFNEKAKEAYLKYNTQNILHDYHMLMMCFLMGSVYFYNDSLVHHRIHSNNAVGIGKKSPFLIELKDFLKYIFNNTIYRKIMFKLYFDYIEGIRQYDDVNRLCIKKKVFNETEIRGLNYFQRKIWYYKHFFSIEKGIFRELIRLLLF